MKLVWTHNGNEYANETDTLGADALAYLLNYGHKQSLQDCIAGREKKVTFDMAFEFAAKEFGVEKPTDEQVAEMTVKHATVIAEAVKMELHALLQKRRDAIQAGTIKVGGSGQRDPFESLCWEIAEGRVLVKWKAKFGKGPQKGEKSTFETRVEEYLAKDRADIEKEAKRRQSFSSKGTVDIEL